MLIKTERDLDELWRGAQTHAVIAAWSAAGAFEALADGRPRRLEELPGDTRALARTAAVLAHVGLLVGDGTTWALSRTGQELLRAGVLRLPGTSSSLGDLSRLDAVVRDGGPVRAADGTSRVTEGGVREHDPANARAFMDMLYRRSAESAEEVGRWLGPRLPPRARVLDLGGGHGRYARLLADRGAEVTLYDRPVCVEIARERHGEALSYRAGDFLTDDLCGPWDAVLLSNIVHGLGPVECAGLFGRVAAATAPSGLVVVKDMLLGEHGSLPVEAAFFDLTMLMYTREGRSYGVSELRELLGAAGFRDMEHVYVGDARFSLLMGRRA